LREEEDARTTINQTFFTMDDFDLNGTVPYTMDFMSTDPPAES
ncbi:hypothetical protein A2U01_0052370, partial [Trifolium medium]|nr:hypothetical protein [Trifolium medium]